MGGRRGIPSPCGDSGRLSKDLVSSANHLAQLGNRLGEVVLLGGMPPRRAMQGAVEQSGPWWPCFSLSNADSITPEMKAKDITPGL
jgi:hypothetical protein